MKNIFYKYDIAFYVYNGYRKKKSPLFIVNYIIEYNKGNPTSAKSIFFI
jgi:hypothetical protein